MSELDRYQQLSQACFAVRSIALKTYFRIAQSRPQYKYIDHKLGFASQRFKPFWLAKHTYDFYKNSSVSFFVLDPRQLYRSISRLVDLSNLTLNNEGYIVDAKEEFVIVVAIGDLSRFAKLNPKLLEEMSAYILAMEALNNQYQIALIDFRNHFRLYFQFQNENLRNAINELLHAAHIASLKAGGIVRHKNEVILQKASQYPEVILTMSDVDTLKEAIALDAIMVLSPTDRYAGVKDLTREDSHIRPYDLTRQQGQGTRLVDQFVEGDQGAATTIPFTGFYLLVHPLLAVAIEQTIEYYASMKDEGDENECRSLHAKIASLLHKTRNYRNLQRQSLMKYARTMIEVLPKSIELCTSDLLATADGMNVLQNPRLVSNRTVITEQAVRGMRGSSKIEVIRFDQYGYITDITSNTSSEILRIAGDASLDGEWVTVRMNGTTWSALGVPGANGSGVPYLKLDVNSVLDIVDALRSTLSELSEGLGQ